MYLLTQQDIHQVSGAANGIYYFEGLSYEFSCPGVSQNCLDTYLGYLEKCPPESNIQAASMNDAFNACGGVLAIGTINACLNPVMDEIYENYGFV